MSRRDWLIALLVLALLGYAGYWFFENFERVEVEVDTGLRGEARTNPLLAARRFLRRMGADAGDWQPMTEGIEAVAGADVVLLLTARVSLDARRIDALLDWVDRGGHLVLALRQGGADGPGGDALLGRLGLEGEWAARDAETRAANATVVVDFPHEPTLLEVAFRAQPRIVALPSAARVLADDLLGACLVHLAHGAGAVSVLCDPQPFANRSIGEHDHARALWSLVNLERPAGRVLLVWDDEMPALPLWLWRNAPAALVAAGLLLALALWRGARRFGPPVDVAPAARRRIVEHVAASGRFVWERRGQGRLLAGMRRALERTVQRRHPAWGGLSPRARIARLATVAELPEALVERALGGMPGVDREAFTEIVQDLETIRKRL